MFAISVVLFVTGLIGLIGLLAVGTPMVRAAERQFELAAARDRIKKLRSERGALNVQLAEADANRRALAESLESMQAEMKSLNGKIDRLPKQINELTFEIGAPETGLLPFDFMLGRNPSALDVEKVAGPERQLWQQARVLRVWSRSLANAAAAAEKRYPMQNGFIIRAALRAGATDRHAIQG
ncbi:MAG: hypothetical protein QOJ54_279 [Aliidongia sp.]|jgi:hypothetical protein|nr:hypothetical protein [Aliidongia sp.]